MLMWFRKNDQAVVIKGSDRFENTLKVAVLDIRGCSVSLGRPQKGDTTLKEALDRWADDGGAGTPDERPCGAGRGMMAAFAPQKNPLEKATRF